MPTNVLVLDISSGLAFQLGLRVGLFGEMLDKHFLWGGRVSRLLLLLLLFLFLFLFLLLLLFLLLFLLDFLDECSVRVCPALALGRLFLSRRDRPLGIMGHHGHLSRSPGQAWRRSASYSCESDYKGGVVGAHVDIGVLVDDFLDAGYF